MKPWISYLTNNTSSEDGAKKLFNQTIRHLSDMIHKVVIPESRDNLTEYVEHDSENIYEWLSKQPPLIIKGINEQIEKASKWGTELSYYITCKDCGMEKIKIEIPMNPIYFFM